MKDDGKKPPTESPLRSSSSRHSFGSDSDHAASKLTSREIAMSSENGKSWTATAAVRRRSFFLIDDDRRRRESRRRFSLSTLLLRCSALLSLFFTRCGTRKREREKRRDGRRQPSYLGKRKLSQRQVPSAEGGEKGKSFEESREERSRKAFFCFFLRPSPLSLSPQTKRTRVFFFHSTRRSFVSLFLPHPSSLHPPAHYAARSLDASRQRRARLELVSCCCCCFQASAAAPPTTLPAHRRPRRKRHRGGLPQGRRRGRRGRLRRQHRRFLLAGQGGRLIWFGEGGRRKREKERKRKRGRRRRRSHLEKRPSFSTLRFGAFRARSGFASCSTA